MLFARAHSNDAKGLPETAAEHTLVYGIQRNGTKRAARDAPHTATFAQNAGTKEAETPNQDQVFGITQDTVVKGQKHFMVAVAGVTPLRIPAGEQGMYHAGVPVGDPTTPGKCIGYALDKARWDPCHDSYVVDVHIAHHYQNEAVGTYLDPLTSTGGHIGGATDTKINEWGTTNRAAIKDATTTVDPVAEGMFFTAAELNKLIDAAATAVKPLDKANEFQMNMADMIGTEFWWNKYMGQTDGTGIIPPQARRIQMGRLILHRKEAEAKQMADKILKVLKRVKHDIGNSGTQAEISFESPSPDNNTLEKKDVTATDLFLNPDDGKTYRVLQKDGLKNILTTCSTLLETRASNIGSGSADKAKKKAAVLKAKKSNDETLAGIDKLADDDAKYAVIQSATKAAMSAPAAAAAAAAAAEPVAEPAAAMGGAPRPDTGAAKSKKKRRRPRAPDEAPLP